MAVGVDSGLAPVVPGFLEAAAAGLVLPAEGVALLVPHAASSVMAASGIEVAATTLVPIRAARDLLCRPVPP